MVTSEAIRQLLTKKINNIEKNKNGISNNNNNK